jgi:hypothetical protein
MHYSDHCHSNYDTTAEREERDATLAGMWEADIAPSFTELDEIAHEMKLNDNAMRHIRTIGR